MSKKITAYSCEFKCGHAPFVRRQSAESHESGCIQNPATRSCPTCIHNKLERVHSSDYMTEGFGGYYCDEDHLEDGEKMKKKCLHWKAKI